MLALITATNNSISTLSGTLASIEKLRNRVTSIFVDGNSTDGTLEHLSNYVDGTNNAKLISQKGRGLYQALNQGIAVALDDPKITHIGMLHSDDKLITAAFERYLSFIENEPAMVFYSDIEFHSPSGKRIRVWDSSEFSKFKLNTGWMPPHTSMIVVKNVYQQAGLYNPEFGTAADYEWIVRVLSEFGGNSRYFSERTVAMQVGGASSASLKARLRANSLDGKVWQGHFWLQSVVIRFFKPLRKLGQYIFVK